MTALPNLWNTGFSCYTDPPGECLPFRLYVNAGPTGGDYERIVRHPVVEYTYPALVAMERAPFDYARFKMGGSDRKMTKSNAWWCTQEAHPKWDQDSNAYNFGVVHFAKAILLTETNQPMKFAQPGQEIKGPCRICQNSYLYASVTLRASRQRGSTDLFRQ
ncbi:unnamed protein product [Allacma fusca]|uniref:Uncharacterized protein n=1 Tax=Allacma fusca TaxID=39272 RepID=A0A8J2LKU5_9HEXA|nr:unnamed protein product [Allacma fusca]